MASPPSGSSSVSLGADLTFLRVRTLSDDPPGELRYQTDLFWNPQRLNSAFWKLTLAKRKVSIVDVNSQLTHGSRWDTRGRLVPGARPEAGSSAGTETL